MSEHIEQFNDYCARVLGYVVGRFEDHPVYYTHDGYFVGRKNEYDPYNNLECALEVVDELVAKFGIAVNAGTVRDYGSTAGAHQLINNAIANYPLNDEGNLKTSEMVEEKGSEDDGMDGVGNDILRMIRERQEETNKEDKKNKKESFNEHCADIVGLASVSEYVKDALDYNPYNNVRQLQSVLNVLKDDYGLVPEEPSAEAARKLIWWYVAFGSECPKKKDEEFIQFHEDGDYLQFHHDLDVNSQYQEPPPVREAPVEEEGSVNEFNAQCINIVRTHSKNRGYSIALPDFFDPYNNTDNLLYVLEVVLKVVPDSITFNVSAGQNTDMIAEMRLFINTYGIDKYMLSEEDQFNKMCAGLVEAYDIDDCQPVESEFFNPYDVIQDLTPIVSVIIETVGVGFTIEAPSVDYDIHNRLRAYAQEYGQEVLDLMEDG